MNFDLKERTILLTIAGSRAYNIHTEESDVDVKGICVPTKEYFHGFLNNFEQADKASHMKIFYDNLLPEEQLKSKNGELEGSVYGILKFFDLAAACNPNILDLLFCRDEEVRLITPVGKLLRENADLFLSKKARFTFSGYSRAQLKRIKSHRQWLLNPIELEPKRSDFDLPDDNLIPKNQLEAAEASIKKKLDSWEIDFGDSEESMKIYIQAQIATYLAEVGIGANEEFAAAARLIGYDENLIHMLQREREFKYAHTQWKQYQEWKRTRNPKRAALEAKYSYDTKHAAHLVRLMRMCREILEKGEVNVWRTDAEELLVIRNGAWTYDKLITFAEEEDKKMDDLYKTSSLRHSPDKNKLDELCIKLVENML